jgi:quinol monooxygenase YgiN
MIVRIVKMTFMESKIENFKAFARSSGDKIRHFEGCQHLDFLQDIHNKNIFFSYSLWESEKHLNNYRKSDFFKDTWEKTRQWFKDKPEAWSTKKLNEKK